MAFIKVSDHGFVNSDQVMAVSSYTTASPDTPYAVRCELTDGSTVSIETLGEFATQAEAMAAAGGLLSILGAIFP